jgi:ATP-dependent helicase/DNAse subunit B
MKDEIYRELNKICSEHIFEEKILIMPSQASGWRFMQAWAQQGNGAVNLRPNTLPNLAAEMCSMYLYQNNIKLIPEVLAHHYLIEVLKKLKNNKVLKYFDGLSVTPELAAAIYQMFAEIRLAGWDASSLNTNAFAHQDKGKDLKRILEEYEALKKENGFFDMADLYQKAIGYCQGLNAHSLYILPFKYQLYPLEVQFLEALAGQVIVLSPKDRETKVEREGWHGYGLALDEDVKIEMFQADGEWDQVQETIRRIKEHSIPFDQVAIFHTDTNTYNKLFWNMAQRLEIPVTFGEGLDIVSFGPGRLFIGLLNWIAHDYPAHDLCVMLMEGELKPEDEMMLPPNIVVNLLRSIGVGWGRGRYSLCLDREIAKCEKALDREESDSERVCQLRQRLTHLVNFKAFIEKLFAYLPGTNELPNTDESSSTNKTSGANEVSNAKEMLDASEVVNANQQAILTQRTVPYNELAKGLLKIVETFGCFRDDMDGKALNKLTDILAPIIEYGEQRLELKDAINRLQNTVEKLKIGDSNPRPGHLHICHYREAMWVIRPYTFIIGLDTARFPGMMREDPILLDRERESLGPELLLRRERIKENFREIVQLLGVLSGTVIFGYSGFDTVENRVLFPSSLLLQVYRMHSGDEAADYSCLMEYLETQRSKKREEKRILNDQDWWINSIHDIQSGTTIPLEIVLSCYPNLRNGIEAIQNRRSERFTRYDGRVELESQQWDPRQNNRLVMSCTQIETLATCPFKYFLKYILEVEPPEELIYDPAIWLDPLTRGNLFHELFEKFYKSLQARGERPKLHEHEQLIYEMADELLVEYRTQLPPPSRVVYEWERQEILNSGRIFLAGEEEGLGHGTPCYFELFFKAQPVELPSGERFLLNGKIDRIDRQGENSFIIIDYKTGSTYAYDANDYYKGGRQIQHTLYAVAIEGYLKNKGLCPKPQVVQGGYVFPTLKGQGQRIMREQSRRHEMYEILGSLFNILSSGVFIMTEDQGDCRFCDYIEVCQRQLVEEFLAQKAMDETVQGIEHVRKVKCFE